MKRIINEVFGGNKIENKQYIIMMIIIYLQYSLWMLQYSALIRVILTLMASLMLMALNSNMVIKKQYMYITMIMVGLVILNCTVNFYISSTDILVVILWICAMLICSSMSQQEFCVAYIKVVTFLSLFGAIIYVISIINPSFFASFPSIDKQSWTGNLIPKNSLFAVVDIVSNYKRAFGIFYEPGLFSFHICMGIFLQLFVCKNINIKRIVIMSIALFLTFSTNGYITFILLVMALFFSGSNIVTKVNKKKILFFMAIIIVMAIIYMYLNPSNWNFLSGKLNQLKSGEGSGYERARALNYSWKLFIKNPIFGAGFDSFTNYFTGVIATFTPFNWFAIYGIFYGILCNFLYIRLAFIKKQNIISSLLKVFALVFMIITQNVSAYLIIFIFIIYNFNLINCNNKLNYFVFMI